MKRTIIPITIALLLSVAGCGTSDQEPMPSGASTDVEKETKREIIAELKQTVSETPKRDLVIEEIKDYPEFKDGPHDKQTERLIETLAVQQMEGEAALAAIENVYGGENEFRKEGILFYGTNEEPGFWIGIKNPDERVDELVNILQEKVDKGEILAKYITIIKNDFTEEEQRALTDKVAKVLKEYVVNHYNPDVVSYSASVDTRTGNIEIGHNFLEKEQMEQLKEEFSGYTVVFEQQGQMVPKEGEADVKYPNEEFSSTLVNDGSIIIRVGKNGFLTAMTIFDFKDAEKKLKPGQRVIVAASGGIMESLPAQGKASFVEVLPDYKPEGADLSESEVAVMAIKETEDRSMFVPSIVSIIYNEDRDEWTVSISQEEEYELVFKDE